MVQWGFGARYAERDSGVLAVGDFILFGEEGLCITIQEIKRIVFISEQVLRFHCFAFFLVDSGQWSTLSLKYLMRQWFQIDLMPT